jgi:hypothetical protein
VNRGWSAVAAEKVFNMSGLLKPEQKSDDLTQTTEPESIQLTENEADAISAGRPASGS